MCRHCATTPAPRATACAPRSFEKGFDPLWAQIRAETQRDAASEPLLSSYLYACVLAHDSLDQARNRPPNKPQYRIPIYLYRLHIGARPTARPTPRALAATTQRAQALSFVLANRLADATLLATQLAEIFSSVLDGHPELRAACRADLAATRHRDPACRTYADCLLFYKARENTALPYARACVRTHAHARTHPFERACARTRPNARQAPPPGRPRACTLGRAFEHQKSNARARRRRRRRASTRCRRTASRTRSGSVTSACSRSRCRAASARRARPGAMRDCTGVYGV